MKSHMLRLKAYTLAPILLSSLLSAQAFSQNSNILSGEIARNGFVQCFEEGEFADDKPIFCETSAVTFDGQNLIIASDKRLDSTEKSAIFSIDTHSHEPKNDYFLHETFRSTQKFEDLAFDSKKNIVFATTGFDRIKKKKNKWDSYNRLLAWPAGNREQVQIVHASSRKKGEEKEVSSSRELRAIFSKLLEAPYFKIEGLTVVPSDISDESLMLFGVREYGEAYDNFKYAVTIISVPYRVENSQVTLKVNKAKIFFSMKSEDAQNEVNSQYPLGLSSLAYDSTRNLIYVLTSYESKDATEMGAYLWTLTIDQKNLTPVYNSDQNTEALKAPLQFNHKGEGVAIIRENDSANTLFVIHDDDRNLSDGRKRHQGFFSVIRLK